jgi:iron complex outermembrane receptor protein
LWLCTSPALAQNGWIVGSVRDSEKDSPIPGALVEVIDETGAFVAQALAGPDGAFRVEIEPGTYTVRFRSAGWYTEELVDQSVTAGETTTANAALTPNPYELDALLISVSKMEEKLTEAPAAVEIATRREISARPSTTIIDHVKGKAGVDVFTTGVQSHNVVIRGFNNILSGGVLNMIDNRIARIPAIRANLAYLIPTTDLDLDRMEVVLGPGSALYGPNADNGVIHSITKSPIDDPGLSFSLAGGLRQQGAEIGDGGQRLFEASDEGIFHGEGRIAVSPSDKLGFKLSGQYFMGTDYLFIDDAETAKQESAAECEASAFDLMNAGCLEFADGLDLTNQADRQLLVRSVENVAGGRDLDLERWSLDGRLDWRPSLGTSLVVAAGRATALSNVDLTPLGAAQVIDWAYDYAQVRLRSGDLFAQVFLNKNDNSDTFLLRSGRPLIDKSEQWVGQLQYASRIGERHDLIYGAEVLYTVPKTEGTINGQFEDDDTITEVGGYLQWRYEIDPRLDLTGGARIDNSSRLDRPVFSPRAALVFKPRPGHSLRATFNRAFSTPSTVSLFLDISGGTVPLGGPFAYDIRATGSSGVGFKFARDASGIPMHQSPFAPLLGGSPREFLRTTTDQLWAEAVALISLQDPEAGQLLAAIASPTEADVPVVPLTLNPDEEVYMSMSGGLAGIDDIPELKPSTTTTFEVGYKGLIGDNRLLLAANAWYSRVSDRISDQRVISPNVFLEGGALGVYLERQFLALVPDVFPDDEAARAEAGALAGTIGAIPLGVITPEQAGGTASAIVLADRNLLAFDLFGAEISARYHFGDADSEGRETGWEAEGAVSFVNDDQFAPGDGEAEGAIIPLNAPTVKGAGTIRYRDDRAGINGQIRFRAQNGFPMNSGVYSGDVDAYAVLDVGLGYRVRGLRGVWLQLDVQNLFDNQYRSSVGAPELGRFMMLRVRYDTSRF